MCPGGNTRAQAEGSGREGEGCFLNKWYRKVAKRAKDGNPLKRGAIPTLAEAVSTQAEAVSTQAGAASLPGRSGIWMILDNKD
jgi:hypothetical protein